MSSKKTSTAGNSGIWLSQTAASRLTDESIKWEERKPLGVRFIPTDKVLAETFLCGKVFGLTDSPVFKFFRDKEVYECEPSDLSRFAHDFGEGKMYFFTTIKAKYPNAGRKRSVKTIFKRETPGGFWQKTGGDSSFEVTLNDVLKPRVTKASLAFHKKDKNSGKQEETPWRMKEYMLDMKSYENLKMKDPLVLCEVYKINDVRDEEVESSQTKQASSSLVPSTQNTNPDSQQNLGKRNCRPLNLQHPASSNLAATPEKRFHCSYQMPVMGSQDAPNPNDLYPSSSPASVLKNIFWTQESGQFQNINSLLSNQSHFMNPHNQPYKFDPNLIYPSMNASRPMLHIELPQLMPYKIETTGMTISTNDPNCDLEQVIPPGGSMVPTLPTAFVSAGTNDMSLSMSEFCDLSAPHLQAEAPLPPPLEEGQSIQHLVAQDEEILFPGRTKNAGYAKSSWSIHEPAVDQPSHPIDWTESGMSDQNDNRFHTFGLPYSELESTRTRPIHAPPSMGRAAPFSAWADPAFAAKPWLDIYWENTHAVQGIYQDSMAEQPLSEQLQHQQLQQLDIFFSDACLNESVIEQFVKGNALNSSIGSLIS